VFADFDQLSPGLIVNVTNGITPRRWLHHANKGLSGLITELIGPDWAGDLSQLRRLVPWAEQSDVRHRFRTVKQDNKQGLARMLRERIGVPVNPASLFDVQIKRMHEYKRQLLNVLHVITRYNRIREGRAAGMVPRTVIISGKAAPGYAFAKLVIRHPRRRRRRHSRSDRRRPAEDRLRAELQRLERRVDHSGERPVRADFDRRHRGVRYRQHEARPERCVDDRHAGRREHRNPSRGGGRQHLHLRQDGG
jgi:starch phosphorylase